MEFASRLRPVRLLICWVQMVYILCKVPIYTFNNWRSGLVRIPELAKDKIEEIAGVTIFNRQ